MRAGVRQRAKCKRDQSSSPSESLSESLLEFELEFELELLFEFELELELLFEFEFELELLLEFEFEFELLLEFELLFEFEFEFELELLSEPQDASVCCPLLLLHPSSSAATGAARNEVAMKATVATLAKVFIGGVLLLQKQPSVTAQG